MERTLYQVLGVEESATPQEIVQAFTSNRARLSSAAEHGDVDAANQLKFLKAAFDTLSRHDKRAIYDLRLRDARRRSERAVFDLQSNDEPAATAASDGSLGSDGAAEIKRWLGSAPRYVLPAAVAALALIVVLVALVVRKPAPDAVVEYRPAQQARPVEQSSTELPRRTPEAELGREPSPIVSGPSAGAVAAVSALRDIVDFFDESLRISRSVGGSGVTITSDEYNDMLERHRAAIEGYLRSNPPEREKRVAQAVEFAWTSFRMAGVDIEYGQGTASAEITNGIEESARAAEALATL
jgi:curved DNA-binding protein CbpA